MALAFCVLVEVIGTVSVWTESGTSFSAAKSEKKEPRRYMLIAYNLLYFNILQYFLYKIRRLIKGMQS